MKSFHVITGLPRSGSTLLCNILNQNPRFHASSTSVICQTLATISTLWSNSAEIKSDLVREPERTEIRMKSAMHALVKDWYSLDDGAEIVFDKSRGWGHSCLLLKHLFPEAKIITMVRDPRAVFGSVEKQHRKNPILDHATNAQEKEIYNRADQMMSKDGIIGGPITGVMDLSRRKLDGTLFIQFENLVKNPGHVMRQLYIDLDEEPFEHDFEDVKNTATDVDALYLNKFPHEGSGKVQGPDPDEWREFVAPDLASQIMQVYPQYNQTFGYV